MVIRTVSGKDMLLLPQVEHRRQCGRGIVVRIDDRGETRIHREAATGKDLIQSLHGQIHGQRIPDRGSMRLGVEIDEARPLVGPLQIDQLGRGRGSDQEVQRPDAVTLNKESTVPNNTLRLDHPRVD